MKKRIGSTLLALALSLSLLPTATFAEGADASACSCETVCTAESMNADCPVCGADGAQAADCGQFAAPETDEAVTAAQTRIDALPTLEAVTAEDYDAVQSAYDAYEALTEAQQALVTGAEVFEGLFAWFNEQVTPLVNTLTVTIKDASGNDKPVTLTADSDGYYEIGTADELYAFAAAVNTVDVDKSNMNDWKYKYPYVRINGKLTNDITVNPNVLTNGTLNSGSFRQWTPIGKDISNGYQGKFNGNNKTISGLYYNANGSNQIYVGLFGYVGGGATVQNITVTDSYFYLEDPYDGNAHFDAYVGGIAGRCESGGHLSNVKVTNSYLRAVTGNNEYYYNSYVGGIVGEAKSYTVEKATVSGSYISSNAKTCSYSGGIVGWGCGITVSDCSNSGTVTVIGNESAIQLGHISAGGIVGYVIVDETHNSTIKNCYNTGNVTASTTAKGISDAGGIVGFGSVRYAHSIDIENCGNTGAVNSASPDKPRVGGVAGVLGFSGASNGTYTANVKSCYNIGTVTADGTQDYTGSILGGDWVPSTITNCFYQTDTAEKGVGFGIDSTKTYGITEMSTQQFANGEATWKLNGEKADGVWKQTLDTDQFPTLSTSSGTVYYGYKTCQDPAKTYSNDVRWPEEPHKYDNTGVCSVCRGTDQSERYNIWVCGVQVTAGNAGNVLAYTDNDGEVSYDHSTKTLTLNGANLAYDDSTTLANDKPCVGVIYATQDLTVAFKGTNTITVKNRTDGTGYGQYGIRVVGGNLTVVGELTAGAANADGGLTIKFDDSKGARKRADGIYTESGDIYITSGIVTVTGGDASNISYGICAKDGNVTIDDPAEVTAIGGKVNNTASDGTGNELNAYSRGVIAWKNQEEDTGKVTVQWAGTKLIAEASDATAANGEAYSEGIHAVTLEIKRSATVQAKCGTATPANGKGKLACGIIASGELTIRLETSVTASLMIYQGTKVTLENSSQFPKISLVGGSPAKLSDLLQRDLKSNYMIQEFRSQSNHEPVSGNTTELTDVYVAAHTQHRYDSNGACECGLTRPIKLTSGTDISYYATFDEAYAAASNGDTITLMADAAYTPDTDPVWDKALTVDLNGHKLTCEKTVAVTANKVTIKGTGAKDQYTGTFSVDQGGELKLETATDKTLTVNSVVLNGGTLTVNNKAVTVNSLTVKDKGSTALTKGSFGTITIADDAVDGSKTVGTLLSSGYGFRTPGSAPTWYDSDSTATKLTETVTVYAIALKGVALSPEKWTYQYGDSIKLTAEVTRTDTAEIRYDWYMDDAEQPFASTTQNSHTPSDATPHIREVDSEKLTIGKHTFYVKVTTHGYTKASAPISVTVNKKPVELDVTIQGWTYGEYDATVNAPQFNHPDGASEPVITYTWDGAESPSTDVPAAVKAGAFEVSVQYETATEIRSGKAAFTVTPKALTVTAMDKSAYVGSTAPDFSAPVKGTDYTIEGLVAGDDVTVLLTCQPNMKEKGTYDIVPTISGEKAENYTLTPVNGTLTVTNRPDSASSYQIVLEHTGGTLKSSHRSAAEAGETVTLTLTPDQGYALEALTVLDKKGKEVALTSKGNGKYSFKMPASKVTVKAVFTTDENAGFVDVPVDAYFANAVKWAAESGITGGVDATHFMPYNACTRAQVVTFLYRAAVANGLDVSVGENTNILSFNDAFDVPEYAVSAFQWAVGAGVLQGNNGYLNPNAPCTRAQIVAFLFRFAAANGMDFVTLQELVSGYADAGSVPGYALSAFNWALAGGIVQGNGGSLMPNNTCTRAQIVTMLYRLLGN